MSLWQYTALVGEQNRREKSLGESEVMTDEDFEAGLAAIRALNLPDVVV